MKIKVGSTIKQLRLFCANFLGKQRVRAAIIVLTMFCLSLPGR
ncbi:hypothetical protein BGLA2_1080064 [Burkholderia gladioli]|nr:hypothetical protein BGLA2_1080064 [Burkholderia gladioli]